MQYAVYIPVVFLNLLFWGLKNGKLLFGLFFRTKTRFCKKKKSFPRRLFLVWTCVNYQCIATGFWPIPKWPCRRWQPAGDRDLLSLWNAVAVGVRCLLVMGGTRRWGKSNQIHTSFARIISNHQYHGVGIIFDSLMVQVRALAVCNCNMVCRWVWMNSLEWTPAVLRWISAIWSEKSVLLLISACKAGTTVIYSFSHKLNPQKP